VALFFAIKFALPPMEKWLNALAGRDAVVVPDAEQDSGLEFLDPDGNDGLRPFHEKYRIPSIDRP